MSTVKQLPSYAWCSVDPAGDFRTADLVCPPAPPIPPLLPSVADLPLVDESSAVGADEPLLPVVDRRIRTLAAYWHSGWPFAVPQALLRQGALGRLRQAAAALPPGFGLAVWDAWRDPRLQQALHEVTYRDPLLPSGFVSPPSADPRTPPPHATGGTVDLTLTWRGIPLSLGTQFDQFVEAAASRALEQTPDGSALAPARDLRRLLRAVMVNAGFVQLDCEWWHFEYGTRLWAAVHQRAALYLATSPPEPPPVAPSS